MAVPSVGGAMFGVVLLKYTDPDDVGENWSDLDILNRVDARSLGRLELEEVDWRMNRSRAGALRAAQQDWER
jgi:hypothetical protein